MSSYLYRTVSKTIRPSPLSKFQKRNSGTSVPNEQKQVKEIVAPKASGSFLVPLAAGLSLGLSLHTLFPTSLRDKLFPNSEPVREQAQPAVDIGKVMDDRLIGYFTKIVQLEQELKNVREDIRERNHQSSVAAESVARSKSGVDIFELSQVIEANNLANLSTRRRELEEQRKALSLDYSLKLEGEMLKVENKYRPVINRIKELEVHLENQRLNQEKEKPAKLLWITCQALLAKMRFSSQGPLEQNPEYQILKQFAANNNQLAISVLDAIPAKALKQGFESEESLVDRFGKVEEICKRVALIDERGGGIGNYLVSYLQSFFLINNVRAIPEDELTGRQLIDPTSWSTFDILARVKVCLKRHNLDLATRYANQLRGQARVVARDWIRDARIHLEVAEAFKALSAYAESVAVDSVRQNFVNK